MIELHATSNSKSRSPGPTIQFELGERKMGPARRHAFRRCEGGEILSGLRE